MQRKNTLIFLVLLPIFIFSQKKFCRGKIAFSPNDNDIIKIYKDYSKESGSINKIILIDYYIKDNISIYTVTESDNIEELIGKRPSCYFDLDTNIIYLHSFDYYEITDSIWLNKVLKKTIEIINRPINITAFWSKHYYKYRNMDTLSYVNVELYDPNINKYFLKNSKIIKKINVSSMLLPPLF